MEEPIRRGKNEIFLQIKISFEYLCYIPSTKKNIQKQFERSNELFMLKSLIYEESYILKSLDKTFN